MNLKDRSFLIIFIVELKKVLFLFVFIRGGLCWALHAFTNTPSDFKRPITTHIAFLQHLIRGTSLLRPPAEVLMLFRSNSSKTILNSSEIFLDVSIM